MRTRDKRGRSGDDENCLTEQHLNTLPLSQAGAGNPWDDFGDQFSDAAAALRSCSRAVLRRFASSSACRVPQMTTKEMNTPMTKIIPIALSIKLIM